jgi:hypothetical protein
MVVGVGKPGVKGRDGVWRDKLPPLADTRHGEDTTFFKPLDKRVRCHPSHFSMCLPETTVRVCSHKMHVESTRPVRAALRDDGRQA